MILYLAMLPFNHSIKQSGHIVNKRLAENLGSDLQRRVVAAVIVHKLLDGHRRVHVLDVHDLLVAADALVLEAFAVGHQELRPGADVGVDLIILVMGDAELVKQAVDLFLHLRAEFSRSEERRVGKECRL